MHLCNSTTLLAIQHASGDVMVGPPDTYPLQPGDRLMLISNERDMEQLGRTNESVAAPSSEH
jgi:K+/H+ antiporter YhaU regulatory subunit KhtT